MKRFCVSAIDVWFLYYFASGAGVGVFIFKGVVVMSLNTGWTQSVKIVDLNIIEFKHAISVKFYPF